MAFDFRAADRAGCSGAGGEMAGLAQIQLHLRQQRAGRKSRSTICAPPSTRCWRAKAAGSPNIASNTGRRAIGRCGEFLVKKLKHDAAINCTIDDILIVSGSLQALDLINGALLAPGDTVICERDNYKERSTAHAARRQRRSDPARQGRDADGCAEAALAALKRKGVRPKFIYTIATVQNPTGTMLPLDRRKKLLRLAEEYGVPIVEDDCYADLIWDGERPPAIYSLSKSRNVIHVGSFSKTIAPALRLGFVVAPWAILSRMLALKTDAGTGGLEQMMLAEYCETHFAGHVKELRQRFRAKLDTLVAALNEQFGTAAEFDYPPGGIFLWVKLPDNVDTMKLGISRAKPGC